MRVGIVLFPFPFSPSPNSQHPCPPLPPQKKNYGLLIGWNGNFLAWHWKLFTTSMFLIYRPWFCLCTSFLALRGVLAPSRAVFLHLCLCSGCSPGCPFSYPVYLTNPCPFLKIQMKCCLSPYISLHSFPTHFISPTSPPIHNPLNDSIIHTVL